MAGAGSRQKESHGRGKYAGKPHGESGGRVQRFLAVTVAFSAGRLDGQSPAVGLQKRHQPRTFPSRAATSLDLPPLNGTACRERHGEKAQRRRPVNFQPSSSFDTTWHRVATLQSALWTGVGS